MPIGLTSRCPKRAVWIGAVGLVGMLLIFGGVPAVQAQECLEPPFPPPTPPALSKSFGAPSIPVNGTTTLTFVLTNYSCFFLTGISFSDRLPPGLIIATPNGLTVPPGAPPCVGAVTATEGSTTISVASVILHPKFFTAQSQCTFSVNVIGTTPGRKDNTTSAVTANETLHGWVPCAVAWDPETGRFTRVEGPDAFTTWGEAEEASRFLQVRPPIAPSPVSG